MDFLHPALEQLPDRVVPAAVADVRVFAGGPAAGLYALEVFADDADDRIVVDADANGNLTVTDFGQPVPVTGGTPTLANTAQVRVSAASGNDSVLVTGNVVLLHPFDNGMGSLAVQLVGGGGDDLLEYDGTNDATLNGQDGNDTLVGGSGDDALFGGVGDDQLFGNAGDDWLFGQDGTDTLDGGAGNNHLFP